MVPNLMIYVRLIKKTTGTKIQEPKALSAPEQQNEIFQKLSRNIRFDSTN